MTVRDIIAEPLESLGMINSKSETDQKVIEIAQKCQLNINHLNRFPHSFSGGQRQRISIARSLIAQPEFIVADESVAALDVSIQAGILQLLKSLQDEMGLTIMFISHDLSVISNFCDEVAVMYLGKIVEFASRNEIFLTPKHPYTRALLNAVPSINPHKKNIQKTLEGEIPSIYDRPNGCVFQSRCSKVIDQCRQTEPLLNKIDNHAVACINLDD
jgi:oligopeptide/dipeptide ABC transporter ATP-binding protein